MKETYEYFQIIFEKVSAVYEWSIVIWRLLHLRLICSLFTQSSPTVVCVNEIVSTEGTNTLENNCLRKTFIYGQKNVKHRSLCIPKNVYLPPLYMKLGLTENFAKPWAIVYLKHKFSKISDVKIIEGIFGVHKCDNARLIIWGTTESTRGTSLENI